MPCPAMGTSEANKETGSLNEPADGSETPFAPPVRHEGRDRAGYDAGIDVRHAACLPAGMERRVVGRMRR